jgi:hypothetical protein
MQSGVFIDCTFKLLTKRAMNSSSMHLNLTDGIKHIGLCIIVLYTVEVQTSSEAHPATCLVGTGDHFLKVKRSQGVMLTAHSI